MNALATYRNAEDRMFSQPVRLAALMNLPKAAGMNDLAIADAIEGGLPVRAFDAIAAIIRSIDETAVFKVISESTYRRARRADRKRLSREASERVYDLARVLDEALGAFRGDLDSTVAFLRTRNPMLKGRTPFDVARSSTAGADAVIGLVRRARAGVAA